MPVKLDPVLSDFVLKLSFMVLVAFAVMIGGAVYFYSRLVKNRGTPVDGVAKILREADVPKMTTIIMIIAAVSLLALLRIVAGEAAIALLSAIAGYVLGNRTAAPGLSK